MHVPDHLISNGPELVAGLTATGVVVAAAAGTQLPGRRDDAAPAPTLLRDPARPGAQMAVAALVFALQMVNFPVLPGTSGHLLGGALATALIGPRRALVAVSSVVVAQALFFADGGTGALGVNLWLIAIVPVAVAAAVERAGRALRSGRPAPWWSVAGIAAVLAPPVAAAAFTLLHVVGGAGGATAAEVGSSMVLVHLAIGVGEAAITLAVLAAVTRVGERRPAVDTGAVWAAAGASAAALSVLASSQPDGLERVTGELGLAIGGPGSLLHSSPLAGYAVSGLDGPLSGSLAGLIGLALTCAVCAAVGTAGTRLRAAQATAQRSSSTRRA